MQRASEVPSFRAQTPAPDDCGGAAHSAYRAPLPLPTPGLRAALKASKSEPCGDTCALCNNRPAASGRDTRTAPASRVSPAIPTLAEKRSEEKSPVGSSAL